MRIGTARATVGVIGRALGTTGGYRVERFADRGRWKRYHWVIPRRVVGVFRVSRVDAPVEEPLLLFFTAWRSNHPDDYYVIAYGERHTGGPYAELREETEDGQGLRWQYEPRKRDGRNAERKERFASEVPSGYTDLALPRTAAEVEQFLDDTLELVRLRLRADDLTRRLDADDIWEFPEGRRRKRMHVARERNPEVIRRAKEDALSRHGKLVCQVCTFDFHATYGDHGRGFIEAHHTVPVSELGDGATTRVEDIALVCANCHRMLHRRRPWLTMGQLSQLVARR